MRATRNETRKGEIDMNRCPANTPRGNGKNGTIQQGDRVRSDSGIEGHVQSFHGGSHGWVTIESGGYTYTVNTHETSKVGE
jgi:hypothetical protein